jgi:hypothetical protein
MLEAVGEELRPKFNAVMPGIIATLRVSPSHCTSQCNLASCDIGMDFLPFDLWWAFAGEYVSILLSRDKRVSCLLLSTIG